MAPPGRRPHSQFHLPHLLRFNSAALFPVPGRISDPSRNRRFGEVARAAAEQGDRRQIVRLPETVKGHPKNIYQKLEVGNRRGAVEKAKKIGRFKMRSLPPGVEILKALRDRAIKYYPSHLTMSIKDF